MGEQELKKELKKVKAQIISNSKDDKFAKALLDKALSLKGQLSIEPTALNVPLKNMVKEYDFGSFVFRRFKECIQYHTKGGLDIFVSFKQIALWGLLDTMLDMKDRFDTLSEDEQRMYSTILSAIIYYFNAPTMFASDDTAFFGCAEHIIDSLGDLTERLTKEAEEAIKKNTFADDAQFEQYTKWLEMIKDIQKDA